MEKAHLQYVSTSMFSAFGLQPAMGRLLNEADDLKPGTSPYAVISYDYWTQRFGKDPKVIGRTFRLGSTLYEVVGVVEKDFTGTETGTLTDIFVPVTMRTGSLACMGCGWLRILAQLKPNGAIEPIRDRLRSSFQAFREERVKGFVGMGMPQLRERELAEKLLVEPAPAGVSELQKNYARPLGAFAVLVILVLLIACANVANLMTVQAAARAREMALRVSIGAGRWPLIQLMLVESAWIAALAAAIGGMFAWWSAPLLVLMCKRPSAFLCSLSPHCLWPRSNAFRTSLLVSQRNEFSLWRRLRHNPRHQSRGRRLPNICAPRPASKV